MLQNKSRNFAAEEIPQGIRCKWVFDGGLYNN